MGLVHAKQDRKPEALKHLNKACAIYYDMGAKSRELKKFEKKIEELSQEEQ